MNKDFENGAPVDISMYVEEIWLFSIVKVVTCYYGGTELCEHQTFKIVVVVSGSKYCIFKKYKYMPSSSFILICTTVLWPGTN